MSRDTCVNVIAKNLDGDVPLAEAVEASIHAHAGGDASAYKDEVRSKVANLKSNPEFAQALKDGSLPPSAVGEMTPEDMATSAQKAEYKQLQQEAIAESIGVDAMQPNSDLRDNELDTGTVKNTGQVGIEYDAPQAS